MIKKTLTKTPTKVMVREAKEFSLFLFSTTTGSNVFRAGIKFASNFIKINLPSVLPERTFHFETIDVFGIMLRSSLDLASFV